MKVSIGIIALNEEKYIKGILGDILVQTYPRELIEILLVDSGSADKTAEYMREFQKETGFFKIQVLQNEGRNQASGWNTVIRNFTGDALVRIDAHAKIPKDFIEKNVRLLQAGEMVCGGMQKSLADEEAGWKNTLLLAESSMFGSSIADYRSGGKKSYVKSVFHGMYRREVIETVGLFNEMLGRTEDNEYHYRIREAGYSICYDPEIVSWQYARSSLAAMLRQKYGNGFWVALTMRVCPGCLSWFHFVPFMFVIGIFVTTIAALCGFPALSLLMWSAYGLTTLVMTVFSVRGQRKSWYFVLLPVLFLLMHLSYGIGSLIGVLSMPFYRISGGENDREGITKTSSD